MLNGSKLQQLSREIYTKNKFYRAKSNIQNRKKKKKKNQPGTSANINESKEMENPKTTKITLEIALGKPRNQTWR
jgi:hypothetical protein